MSFATSFRGTLELAHKQLDENYEGSHTRKPVVMPEITDLPKFKYAGSPVDGTVEVTLKSIREPKFSVEYTVSNKSSVYSLKERLISDPAKPLKDSKHNANSIKLMLKSKVVSDCRQLAELPSTQFTVMYHQSSQDEGLDVPIPTQIYWGKNEELDAHQAKAAKTVGAEPSVKQLPGVNDQFWKDVEHVAKKYVKDPKQLVDSLRQSYVPVPEMDLD